MIHVTCTGSFDVHSTICLYMGRVTLESFKKKHRLASETSFNANHLFLACFRSSPVMRLKGPQVINRGRRNLTQYVCAICDGVFEGRETYQAHLNSEHEGKSMRCDLCGFATCSSEKLTSHMLGRHNIVTQVMIHKSTSKSQTF